MHLSKIQPGKNIPNDFNVVIEIPAYSHPIKYELNKESEALFVDRFMPTSMVYPCNYGFVPNTLSPDGDPVDVLVMTPFPVQPGCVLRCRALGMLRMSDESGKDTKIFALPIEKICMEYAYLKTMDQLSPVFLKSIQHFFENYKGLEPGKWVKVDGWEGVDAAKSEIEAAIAAYR